MFAQFRSKAGKLALRIENTWRDLLSSLSLYCVVSLGLVFIGMKELEIMKEIAKLKDFHRYTQVNGPQLMVQKYKRRLKREPLSHTAFLYQRKGISKLMTLSEGKAEEHLSNTLRQALIYKALGFPMPYFAHVSLILAPDRSKLLEHYGATSVGPFREMGYLPQEMVN